MNFIGYEQALRRLRDQSEIRYREFVLLREWGLSTQNKGVIGRYVAKNSVALLAAASRQTESPV
jgi:hypothetical protein